MSNIVRLSFLTFLFILGIVHSSSAQQADPVEIIIQPTQEAYSSDSPVIVEFILSNRSPNAIRVLKWNTPVDGVSNDIFLVTRGEQTIDYIGRLVKRGAPTEADFITIEPGQAITVQVDLSRYYAVFEEGRYSVAYNVEGPGLLVGDANAMVPATVVSNSATVTLSADRTPPTRIQLSASNFDQCDSNQQDELNTALTEAGSIASESLQVLQSTPVIQQPNSARYLTWFGVHTPGLYAKVSGNFLKISDAITNQKISFGCNGSECMPIDYAYVYPDQPYGIFVCNKFWLAAATGTDSRSGTIVHEVSHFAVGAAARDFAYGQSASQTLAIENPPRATSNADSHEYFAENNPQLPM